MNRIFSIQIIILFALTASGQTIPYGNNPAAGKYYDVNGIKLYCEIYGTGKPLLLIHGNGGNISAFSKNIAYFAEHYKVIAVDSRAQGKSTDAGDSISFEMMADDFAALLTQLHVDKAYVIGWSDGGINSLELAIRHPDKVIAIASTGANLRPDSSALQPDLVRQFQVVTNRYKNNKATLTPEEKNARKIFFLNWNQPHIPLSDLHKLKCPALIIAGDHDLIRTQHTVEIYENIPKAYLWILPRSGHGTLIEYADEFNRKVDEFFKKGYTKM